MPIDSWDTATSVLRLASQLIEGIQQGLAQRGFDDARPVHGFAFARLAGAPATTADLAEHLGITKQAASELVAYLVERDYLTRAPDPTDRRARLLMLTNRGHACTRAAEQAAAATVTEWKAALNARQFAELHATLRLITTPGRLRPTW